MRPRVRRRLIAVGRAASRTCHRRVLAAARPATVPLLAGTLDNRLWGAERIRGGLLKLDIRVIQATIQKYLRRVNAPQRPGQTWATFLRNHAHAIWACDCLPVTDLRFRSIYAFVVVELASRRVVHGGVTGHPTDAQVARQLREATPFRAASDVPHPRQRPHIPLPLTVVL